MGHSNVRAKVRRRKVAHLAAYSRQFTVRNVKKGISPVVNHKRFGEDLSNAITCPFTGHKFVPTNPHPIPGKFGISITGYDWVEPSGGLLWKQERHKQPKPLYRYKKRKFTGEKWVLNAIGGWMRVYDTKREKRNDFVKFFPNYPYTIHKMNRIEYMEELVKHKLAKWERKNPKPASDDDLFKEEFVHPWVALRNQAEERIRDFVVSVYDKLLLTGRFKINESKYTEEKVAELKDINGEGHHVNALPVTSKLIKKAQDITNKTKAKRPNLVATNLRDHKKQKGRIILPQAA